MTNSMTTQQERAVAEHMGAYGTWTYIRSVAYRVLVDTVVPV